MTVQIDTTAENAAVRLENVSTPSAPASGHALIFSKGDGLYYESASGTVIGPMSTGTVMTAATGDGWVAVTDSWSYASASTITVPSDATTTYVKGMKLRFKQGGGYKYYVISAVAATTLTVIVNTDYTVANSAITNISYSTADSPLGFPGSFNYTPTVTSQTGSPNTVTINSATYVAKAGVMSVLVKLTVTDPGTAGSGMYISAPVNAVGTSVGAGRENAVTGNMVQVVIDGTSANPSRINALTYNNGVLWTINYVVFFQLTMGW